MDPKNNMESTQLWLEWAVLVFHWVFWLGISFFCSKRDVGKSAHRARLAPPQQGEARPDLEVGCRRRRCSHRNGGFLCRRRRRRRISGEHLPFSGGPVNPHPFDVDPNKKKRKEKGKGGGVDAEKPPGQSANTHTHTPSMIDVAAESLRYRVRVC